MHKLWHTMFFTALLGCNIYGQEKIGELDASVKLLKGAHKFAYYDELKKNYIVNIQNFTTVDRSVYDSNYRLRGNYSFPAKNITLDRGNYLMPVFITDLHLPNGVFEIYSGAGKTIVSVPDFVSKTDSIVFSLTVKEHVKDEKQLAVCPFQKGFRLLSYSDDNNELYLYEWRGKDQVDTFTFRMPASSLSPEEIKQYTKDARVKYKKSFDELGVQYTGNIASIGSSFANTVYYNDDKIWILCMTPYNTGYNLLELDLTTQNVTSTNFMLNDMRANAANVKPETLRTPYAVIFNNMLIIRNSSYYYFEYTFYSLDTKQKLREYKAGANESLRTILNSDFVQKGTWISADAEKEIDNEKAYLRKISSGTGFITVSEVTTDSITITTGSYKPVTGPEGLLLGLTTGFVTGMMMATTIGPNSLFIPSLSIMLYRNKLTYCHTRFALSDLGISKAKNVTTALDSVIDTFDKKEKQYQKRSFIIKKDAKYLIAVFNSDSMKFELYLPENE